MAVENQITRTAKDDPSSLMKMVEALAISVDDARDLVRRYEAQVREARPSTTEAQITKIVTDKIISRYSKLALTSGVVTAAPGVVPGVGTAVGVLGGGAMDITACMKIQIDMTMCLAVAINGKLSNEDAKHMSYIIALFGTIEQLGSSTATRIGSKAGVNMVNTYLKGATLKLIKELFKKIGVKFTKKSLVKAIPFGVGVVIGGGANYALTKYVGNAARDAFYIHLAEEAG